MDFFGFGRGAFQGLETKHIADEGEHAIRFLLDTQRAVTRALFPRLKKD